MSAKKNKKTFWYFFADENYLNISQADRLTDDSGHGYFLGKLKKSPVLEWLDNRRRLNWILSYYLFFLSFFSPLFLVSYKSMNMMWNSSTSFWVFYSCFNSFIGPFNSIQPTQMLDRYFSKDTTRELWSVLFELPLIYYQRELATVWSFCREKHFPMCLFT